jgi:putative membrane protein
MFSGEVRPLKLDATSLAVERTRLACERTMMAWIRTGTSMIAFGFSLYKFFDLQAGVPQRMLGPRGYAFLMILAGLVSVVLAGLQNRQAMQRFRAAGADVPYSLATLLGGLVSIVGIIGLLAVVLRL